MEVWSFAEVGASLVPVRVEVSLMRGLPDIRMTGLPDRALKESLIRVKSAIKNQGLALPTSQNILVHLHPGDQPKTGRGLELAVAMAILWELELVPKPMEKKVFAYGRLGLKGEVGFLEEVNWAPCPHEVSLYTGRPSTVVDRPIKVLDDLSSLFDSVGSLESQEELELRRPSPSQLCFSEKLADLLVLLAHGRHHCLLAGPAGSGKSTAAYALHTLLPNPSLETLREIRKWNRYFNRDAEAWCPQQSPHHSATAQSILGGGNPPIPGEVTRAHGGILLLDEFLEFPTSIREGLREPMERGEVRISRKGHSEVLPADFQLVATTNLCPCGDFVPKKLMPSCRFSLNRCKSYLERLSGPLADRFEVLSYSHNWKSKQEIDCSIIFDQIERAQEFQARRAQAGSNSRLKWDELIQQLEKPHHQSFLPGGGRSRRRHLSILRVARSLADIEASEKIQLSHLRRALDYCWQPFEDLREAYL